jgi:hypothetical protein
MKRSQDFPVGMIIPLDEGGEDHIFLQGVETRVADSQVFSIPAGGHHLIGVLVENEDVDGSDGRTGIHPVGDFFFQKGGIFQVLGAVDLGVHLPGYIDGPLPPELPLGMLAQPKFQVGEKDKDDEHHNGK